MPEGPESPLGFALSRSGQRLGPRTPVLDLGLWVLDGQALGGSPGSPALTVKDASPSPAPAPATLSSPCFPGATQGHSWLPRRAYGAARVAFKISLTNQIWLFQETPSLAVPLAGRVQGGREGGTSTFQGPWLSTPCGLSSREHPGPHPLALGGPGPAAVSLAKSPQG